MSARAEHGENPHDFMGVCEPAHRIRLIRSQQATNPAAP
jgi:hypothetical protein